MDRIDITKRVTELFEKYKYVLLILAVGLLLMSLPERTNEPVPKEVSVHEPKSKSHAEELEDILSQISGVGKVKVFLTEASGAETIYQTNEDRNTSNDSEHIRVDTVIITDANREEHGLVRTVTPPVYLGAIIVCQGGDRPSVKLSIVDAVSNVTGISSERISVLKMK